MVLQKEEVFKSFQTLLSAYEKSKAQVATKEELASKAKNRELVKVASGYTSDHILKNLTDLQLNFAEIMENWTKKLQSEAKKQEELRHAIDVEAQRLQELKEVKTAADALYLLKEEHSNKLEALEKLYAEENLRLDEQIEKKRAEWLQEAQEFELSLAEFNKRQERERLREAEEYKYATERQQKLDLDTFDETKRLTERELNENEALKLLNWKEREALLEKQKTDYENNRKKLDEFPAKLDEETKKERKEAADDASREAKIKAELLEKEEAANKQIAEQKIGVLERTIELNNAEVVKLTEQLNDALRKVQELSMQALQNNNHKNTIS